MLGRSRVLGLLCACFGLSLVVGVAFGEIVAPGAFVGFFVVGWMVGEGFGVAGTAKSSFVGWLGVFVAKKLASCRRRPCVTEGLCFWQAGKSAPPACWRGRRGS